MRTDKIVTIVLTVMMSLSAAAAGGKDLYPNNRAPLVHKPYMELPIGAVRPQGWLEDQLQRMAAGMTGHLDEMVPNIMGDRNGWLGGDGDKWERGPYWIDGLLPLAYILDDKTLIEKTQRWVEWTLSSQQENGFFGPSEDLPNVDGLQRDRTHDWWPRIVVLKFMKQYYDATGDERVIPFMLKYFHYQLKELPEHPLGTWSYWAVERGADNILVVYWLYNLTGESFLLELGDLLARQTADWKGRLSDGKTLSTLYSLHCVNLAQGFKAPVIEYQATKDPSYIDAAVKGYEDLMEAIGWPNGMYGADELLHSANPTQGSELCSAVELMFSLEKMIEITGRTDWADWLERVAFNALPTQATDNYDGRQYYQQLNQVEVSLQLRNFMTSYNGTAGLFGVVTGFPCCTANMHQGWPKFTRNLWFASDDNGLAAMVYAPSKVTAKVGDGTEVTISETGGYPFSDQVEFEIQVHGRRSVSFPLHLRIPGWCKRAELTVNGVMVEGDFSAGKTVTVDRKWKSSDKVVLSLPSDVEISRWYENSAAVSRGPLLYALKVGEKWDRVENGGRVNKRYGESWYEVHATTPWNYCLLSRDLKSENVKDAFEVVRREVSGYPWNLESAPLEIRAKGRRIHDWHLYNGSAGPLPYSNQYQANLGEEEPIILVPYGCTTLRIAEFPVTD